MKGNFFFTVRAKALGVYLFALFIFYLAGSYLGAFFLFLFYLLLFSLVISFLHLVITRSLLKYHQDFSTEHPVKGQSVTYRLSVANEVFLPVPYLMVRFKSIHPLLEREMSDFAAHIKGNGRLERVYHIQCPCRGIYTVGLEGMGQEDLLHLFSINLPVWYRTFYVYPRVLCLKHFSSGLERGERLAQGSSEGALPDYSLFRQLREYQQGESIRHISWKKFASTGVPFLRKYETTAEPAVTIYLDLRLGNSEGEKALESEDTSIEILVALVKLFLDRGITTTVRAPGRTVYSFRAESSYRFADFYNSNFELIFQDTCSPLSLYRSEWKNRTVESSSIIYITHIIDPDLFVLIEESLGSTNRVTVVFNQTGYGLEMGKKILRTFNRLRDRGARILVVKDSHSIVEDLEGIGHG